MRGTPWNWQPGTATGSSCSAPATATSSSTAATALASSRCSRWTTWIRRAPSWSAAAPSCSVGRSQTAPGPGSPTGHPMGISTGWAPGRRSCQVGRLRSNSLDMRQIRKFWCPAGMHNHASSRAIGAGPVVLIVSPELCSRARWDVVNKHRRESAGASGYAPLVSWLPANPARVNMRKLIHRQAPQVPSPSRSSRRGWRGRPGCPGARGRGPARGWAAARRTGRGPRPHPPPPRSSGRGSPRVVRVSGCSGPRTRSRDGQQRGELVAGRGRIPRLPGPVGEAVRGWSGCPGARGRGPARGRAAARRTGRGRRPHPPPPRSSGRGCARVARVSGCSGPRTRSRTGSSAANWSRAAAGSPACPVQRARLAGSSRVSGCSGPRTRSRTGSSAANWSRAAAASPASPVQRARLRAGGQGVRVLGAEDPLAHGQQRGELVAGGGRIPRLPGPAGEAGAGGQGVRVLSAVGVVLPLASAISWNRSRAAG